MSNKHQENCRGRISLLRFLWFIASAQILIGLFLAWNQENLLPENPATATARAAMHFAVHYDLKLPEYPALEQQIIGAAKKTGNNYWQDRFSKTISGELVPAHAPIVSIVSSPFYKLFGYFGFWLFQNLSILAIFASCFVLCSNLSQSIPHKSILLVPLLTPFLLRSYGFDYDIFAAACVTGAAAISFRSLKMATGLIFLASLIRVSNYGYFPLVFLPVCTGKQTFKNALREVVTIFIPLLLLQLAVNNSLWGAPFTTGRQRMPQYGADGVIGFYAPEFSWQIMAGDWGTKLFGSQNGLLLFSPILAGLPVVPFLLRRSATRLAFWLIGALIIIQMVVIFSFHCWGCSDRGNRFLFAASALGAAVVMSALQKPVKTRHP